MEQSINDKKNESPSIEGIISLQFGPYSNFVGAHFWNFAYETLQSPEIDTSVLFKGEKTDWTPRTIFVDLKDNLAGFRARPVFNRDKRVNNNNEAHPFWEGSQEVIRQEIDSNPFTQTLQVPFHHSGNTFQEITPNILIPGYQIERREKEQIESIEDQIRKMAEECDLVKGLQVFADVDCGFGVLASDLISELKSEFRGVPLLTYGFNSPSQSSNRTSVENRSIFSAINLQSLSSVSTAYIPLSTVDWTNSKFKNLNLDITNDYHTSAVFASAIETLLLPCRLSKQRLPLDNLICHSGGRMNLSSLSVSLPFLLPPEPTQLKDLLAKYEPLYLSNLVESLTPFFEKKKQLQPLAETVILRSVPFASSNVLKELFFQYLDQVPCTHVSYITGFPFKALPPFSETSSFSIIPTLSYAQTGKGLNKFLEYTIEEFQKANKTPFNKEVEKSDELKEIEQELLSISDEYSYDEEQ